MCKSCAYIAHWGTKYNLAHILCIGEISTILRESCAYIVHWGGGGRGGGRILRIYFALTKESPDLHKYCCA